MYIDSFNANNQDYALNSFSNVLMCSNTILEAKTVTFPVGYNLDTNLSFRVCFINGHNCADASTNMTLNDVPVVVNKYGSLIPLPIHTMTESSQTVYKSLQPNTVLEMYYTANYDGNNNPAFVVIGNPVVLSSADYTIYADGSNDMVETYEVNCSVKGKIYLRKLNKIVQLRYYEYDSSTFNYPTKEQWVRIANVPSELAPKQNLFLSNDGSNSYDFLCQIINNGYLNMYRRVDIFGWEIALNATWII